MEKRTMFSYLAVLLTLLFYSVTVNAKPIQALVDVYGDRSNQLIGYGLVVGLNGSGDKSQVKFTQQSVVNMIEQFGVQLKGTTNPKLKNVAAVSVTGSISPSHGEGQEISVSVSSIGDATSLRGGTLLLTPLLGVDGEIYATAQGSVVVGGLSASGEDGSNVSKNTPTVGRIINGAIVEKTISLSGATQYIRLQLKKPSYKTALNISKKINNTFGDGVATAMSKGRVDVSSPKDLEGRVMFLSMIEALDVDEGAVLPKIIFNSRTGTIVITSKVMVSEVAVSQGGITIRIDENQAVSQPNEFQFVDGVNNTGAETVVTENSNITIDEENPQMLLWRNATELQDIVDTVNRIGATPSDLMQILLAIDAAGALHGELVVL